MTNFVLTGLPDFIVVGSPWQLSRPQPGGEPVHVDSRFAEILMLLGASSAQVELSDRIAYSEAADLALRRVLDRFGFERRPDTYAELYGLLDYCDRLTALSGIGVIHGPELRAWRARSFLLLSAQKPPRRKAVELFCLGELDALRAWHRDPDALLDIGRAYRRLA
jgi:hypothetical protein